MFTLLKNAHVYAPHSLGKKDLLLCADKIVAIEDSITALPFPTDTIDCQGKILTPGLIDQHIHLIGGGGEAGFNSRTPQVTLSNLIKGGLTTVVGVMGTDGISRTPKDLYAKAKALELEGIRTFMHTGSYELPTRTITSNIRDDITFIPSVLGVKIAMSDHRCSFPTLQELLRITSDIRIAGMLSGKKGILHIHMGDLPSGFELINEIVKAGIPRHHLSPTHVSRNPRLYQEAIEFAKAGGNIDITTGGSDPKKLAELIKSTLAEGVNFDRITLSSDGNGSMPRFNDKGELEGLTAAPVNANLDAFPYLVDAGIPMEQALSMLTVNVAKSVGISGGQLAVGTTGDLCLFNDDLSLSRVYAKGKLMLDQNSDFVAIGNFE